jgi:hypothetical protein
MKDRKFWFRRKWYGWGWVPITWQGRVVTLVYAGFVIFISLTLDELASKKDVIFLFILPLVMLTSMLIRICYKTGEKPKWSWGRPKKDGN